MRNKLHQLVQPPDLEVGVPEGIRQRLRAHLLAHLEDRVTWLFFPGEGEAEPAKFTKILRVSADEVHEPVVVRCGQVEDPVANLWREVE
ncbi:hypothetical protein PG996_015159 [Apiospora saccharicola]|uniref:Uncharacterized protein n=1 Tax=Apiospora saccharicola TaxID=335842 RepID=A0ABR1TKB5_9PEZI